MRLALGGGAVLFVCGTAVAMWRATGRALVWRAVLAPAAAVAIFAMGAVPAVAMGILVALLVAIAAIEHRQTHVSWAAAG